MQYRETKFREKNWRCWWQIPDASGFVITTFLNTKISEVENKIPNTSSLVTTIVVSRKISKIENKIPDHAKCVTTPEFNKLIKENFTARL